MKLSTKFTTVILFLILVPLLVSGITLNVNMTQCALKENYTSLSNLAERFGRDTDDYLAQIQEEVRLISLDAAHAQALSQASQGSEDAKTTANLASVEALVKQTAVLSEYRGACLLDSSGAVVVSLSGKRIGKPYAQDGVLELLKHNDAYFSGILHTDDVKSYFFESCAIYTQDVLMGYLVVEFDTSYFSSLARNATVGKTGYIFFVDQQDFIFAHQYPERQAFAISYNNKNGFFQNLAKLRAAQSPLPTGQDLLPGEFEYDYNSQIRLHGAYYPLEPIGGYIFVVRNLDEVRGISSGTTLLANLLLLAIGLFVIAAAIIIILSVKRPSFRILRSIGSMLKESGYIYCDYEADNELGWIAEAVNLLNTDIANIMDDLKEGEKRYRTALEAVSDIVWEYDVAAQKYTFMAKDKGMLGARRVENVDIAGCPWAYAADPEAEERRDAEFKRFVSGAVRTYRTEYETRDIRGNCAWAESIATALKNKDDKIVKVIGSITDITQKKLYDMRVLHSAEYDKLTSIYNRATIERRIKDELPKCEQSALMMVDLDNFKIINDTFGHQFGDQILKFVSSSICKMVSSQDLVGRIGGDEFVVFVKQYASEQALEETANKIVAALQSGYEKEGTTYRLSGSVGVATANQFGAKSYKTLLANA
ncbi:MAG: diguanylate cyclase domain-containing protein, partial [Acetanaerobacterium sp.]